MHDIFRVVILAWLSVFSFCAMSSASVSPEALKLYFDADRTSNRDSAVAIEQGFKVAFAEVGNQLQGIPVTFLILDHRGNALRSKSNMDRFVADPQALVYVGGLHSPPLIKYRSYLNQSQILTLVPWAAGAPITRYPSMENYVFRLSVDDSKVGKKLFDFALDNGCEHPHLLLEETGWGKSNLINMSRAATLRDRPEPEVTWFSWGIDEVDARIKLREIQSAGSDCVLLVANAREGALLVEASVTINSGLALYSHWGITGGEFVSQVPFDVREKAGLRFIQSCFNFYSSPETALSKRVFQQAQQQFPETFSSKNIAAPAGFVHGYDLAQLLIAASQAVTFGQDPVLNRTMLKEALEALVGPIDGLLKTYHQPYSRFAEGDLDAHEALGEDDLCMALYDQNNAVKLLQQSSL